MDRIRHTLELKTIPHFTILQKFLGRVKPINLDPLQMHLETILFRRGFYPNQSLSIRPDSPAGNQVITTQSGPEDEEIPETSITVDTEQQLIIGFEISKNPVHESRHALALQFNPGNATSPVIMGRTRKW